MLTVKAPNIEFTIPSSWEEVTLKQFVALHGRQQLDQDELPYYTVRDMLECFCSDVPQLHQLGAGEEARLRKRLPYLLKRPDFATEAPPKRIAGVTPPDELGACTLLQKWSVEEIMNEYADAEQQLDFVGLAHPMLSVYLYPLITGKLLENTSQIAEITDLIDQLPVTEALPLSAFFLTNWENLTPTGRTSYAISYPSQPPKAWLTRWFPNWKTIRSWRFFGWWPAKSA